MRPAAVARHLDAVRAGPHDKRRAGGLHAAVHLEGRVGRGDDHLEVRDELLEVVEGPLGVATLAALILGRLREEAPERLDGVAVAPERLAGGGDVEEHRRPARELVGAAKFNQRAVVVAAVEEDHAAVEVGPGLGELRLGGRLGRLRLREGRRRAEGREDAEGEAPAV